MFGSYCLGDSLLKSVRYIPSLRSYRGTKEEMENDEESRIQKSHHEKMEWRKKEWEEEMKAKKEAENKVK